MDAGRRGLLLAAMALPAAAPAPDGKALAAMLERRVAEGSDSVGYVAMVGEPGGAPRLLTAGRSGSDRALKADTIFEIGSITKVFTALLLAEMVVRGEVTLADPVARYLPPEGRPKEFDGKPISLLDLATYTSGLPRMPTNFHPKNPANPYADYSVAQLHAFVSSYEPLYYPGSHYEYANLGFGLLGHALALKAGRSYEELLRARICEPLGLADTVITLTPDMQARLAPGHDSGLRPTANWDLPTLAGAGGLRSTAHDLQRFLTASHTPSSLSAAFATLLDVRRQTGTWGLFAAAGWFVRVGNDDELVWKDGGTGGYSSFIGRSARSGRSAVLLSNTASAGGTTGIGLHLLNDDISLPPLRRPVEVDPSALAGLAGVYRLTDRFALQVTPHDGRLMVQATGQAEYEVFPLSPTRFFYRVVDAQLDFECDPQGRGVAVVLHQNGRDQRGLRQA